MANTLDLESNRVYEIDLLRGMAIVLMIIFHFSFDLSLFGWADFDTNSDMEWRIFRAIIVSSFLLAVGMSSYLAYHHCVNTKKLARAVGKLFSVSVLITLGSLVMHPNTWVYFGIIHFITLALPVSVWFVRTPSLALIFGVTSIIGYWTGLLNLTPAWRWGVLHLGLPTRTIDVVSFIPWIGVVLIGVFIMHKRLFNLTIREHALGNKLVFLGQHSLMIYLIHQPIMYGLFSLTDIILDR